MTTPSQEGRPEMEALRDLLRLFVDDEPCRFDHNGWCQNHTLGDPGDAPGTCLMLDVRAALAAVVVSSPATPTGDADLFVADRHRLAGYLDACLDRHGLTWVRSAQWLTEFEADFPASPATPNGQEEAEAEVERLRAGIQSLLDATTPTKYVVWGGHLYDLLRGARS